MTPLGSRWLHTFRVLCEEGHFTRASKRLNMMQPGVSQHLAKLEGQVGQQLVYRDAPSFTLTDTGAALRELADRRWREEQALRETLTAGHEEAGVVRVASSGSFAMLLYPSLIQWMGEAPDLRAELTAAPVDRICAGVVDGEFDLGIVTGSFRHPRIETAVLGHEPLDLLLPAAWQGRSPDFGELQSLGFVDHPDGKAFADILFEANFPSAYAGSEAIAVRTAINQIGQIPEAVAAGLGYTILPRSGVVTFPRADRLFVPTMPRPSSLPLQAICLNGRTRIPRLAKLMRLVRDQVDLFDQLERMDAP